MGALRVYWKKLPLHPKHGSGQSEYCVEVLTETNTCGQSTHPGLATPIFLCMLKNMSIYPFVFGFVRIIHMDHVSHTRESSRAQILLWCVTHHKARMSRVKLAQEYTVPGYTFFCPLGMKSSGGLRICQSEASNSDESRVPCSIKFCTIDSLASEGCSPSGTVLELRLGTTRMYTEEVPPILIKPSLIPTVGGIKEVFVMQQRA